MRLTTTLTLMAVGCASAIACRPAEAPPPAPDPALVKAAQIERGKYLVTFGDCGNCHTPKVMSPAGAVPDETRLLSGRPAGEPVLTAPAVDAGWMAVRLDRTAFSGPWGVSFPRNLTPDQATGLGSWTEEMFIKTLRLGKHQGEGRDLLPPMSLQGVRRASDEDLRAIWAYLQSIPPIDNAVPDPLPPAEPPAASR
jgi:mono/diheme cytochrome c family protein